MQPTTSVKFDASTFERLKYNLRKNTSRTKQLIKNNPRWTNDMPTEIGLKFTHRCNLRCKFCYLWNEIGQVHKFKNGDAELDISVIEKIMYDTSEAKSKLYIMGGEPLVHRDWDDIARLIQEDPRWTTMSTNGLLLDKKMETILPISENMCVLVSLDGFEDSHDENRGKGAFNRTIRNLKQLVSLQRKGEYKGEITVNSIIGPKLIPRLYEFTEFCEEIGIGNFIITFPWYINQDTAERMDVYFKENFLWLDTMQENVKSSWHSYKYNLDKQYAVTLREQINQIKSKSWRFRIRIHPPLENEEFEDFLEGKERVLSRGQRCTAITNRMIIRADGSVTACTAFPEYLVGNIYKQSVREIWHGEKFGKIREIMNTKPWPIGVCSKCTLISYNEL